MLLYSEGVIYDFLFLGMEIKHSKRGGGLFYKEGVYWVLVKCIAGKRSPSVGSKLAKKIKAARVRFACLPKACSVPVGLLWGSQTSLHSSSLRVAALDLFVFFPSLALSVGRLSCQVRGSLQVGYRLPSVRPCPAPSPY